MHQSTKTYGAELGLSACFRQWRAASHCHLLHGYALAISFKFEAETLDANNWVMDFGGLKELKEMLVAKFDHKLLVAADDPYRRVIEELGDARLADVVVVPATGCEAFAQQIYYDALSWMERNRHHNRVRLVSVEVREHGANSALYVKE